MAEEKETIKCPKCGNNLEDNVTFCPMCGYDFLQEKECGANFCAETNAEKSTYKTWQEPGQIPFIVELIFFIVLVACVCFCNFNNFMEFFKNEYENILQQINLNIAMLGMAIFVIIGVLTVLVIWSVFKFNRIERRIIETQKMLNRKG